LKGEGDTGGESLPDPLVARLAKLDSCAVSDALDRLGLKGSVVGIHPLTSTARIAGRAVTVRLKAKGREESPRHLGTAAIQAAGPGDVIVVDHHAREDVAGWGGILSTAAKVKGVAGVIIDGACRDIDEARELGFPVFARAAVQITARGRVVEDSFNEPVEIADVSVRPGDLVIADGSGVVFVAAERAEEVIKAAEEIASRETQMTKDVLAGRSVVEVMGKSYETMLERR
jgi:regulator of RNase E activity RraA